MPKIIYAERLSGDLFTLTFSYSKGLDPEVTSAYVDRLTRKDEAKVVVDVARYPTEFPYGLDPEVIYTG